MPDTITANHTIAIEDVEYQKGMLARLYRPSGAGPFPAALQVHGGAWTSKDRTDNDFMAKALAEGGIFVASIDFRMPPSAPILTHSDGAKGESHPVNPIEMVAAAGAAALCPKAATSPQRSSGKCSSQDRSGHQVRRIRIGEQIADLPRG